MKIILTTVVCFLFLATTATAQELQKAPAKTAPSTSASAPSTSALETKIRKVWEDFKNKDKNSLGTALAEGFREMEEGGKGLGDKKAEIAMVDEFELQNYTLKDFAVKPLGTHAALVTYAAHYEGKSGSEVTKSDSIFGEVWVHEGNAWKALYVQETAVK